MPFGSMTRVNTNMLALHAYNALQRTSGELALRQMRLATGVRLNRAEDDTSGFVIAKMLEARVRGQAQALSNIGDAKSMLTVAEGGLETVSDILITMKEKAIQAANDTLGAEERAAIKTELDSLAAEIDNILLGTTFNDKNLFGAADLEFSFQVGASPGNTFLFEMEALTAGELEVEAGDLDVTDAEAAAETLGKIDEAISMLSERVSLLGTTQSRLSFKQENLITSMTNYEAARSRIMDTDFAKEQMQIARLQILQQTSLAAFAQANAAPQIVLSLFQ